MLITKFDPDMDQEHPVSISCWNWLKELLGYSVCSVLTTSSAGIPWPGVQEEAGLHLRAGLQIQTVGLEKRCISCSRCAGTHFKEPLPCLTGGTRCLWWSTQRKRCPHGERSRQRCSEDAGGVEVEADLLCMCAHRREVYCQLRSIYPHLACRQFLEALQQLEKECGYGEERIPQLREVSAFLRGEDVSGQKSTGIYLSFLSVWGLIFAMFRQREPVSSYVRSRACCRPETSWAVWPSGCFSARSTSGIPLLPCIPPNRKDHSFFPCFLITTFIFFALHWLTVYWAETAATSCWDTFQCWQIKSLHSFHR